MLSELSPQPQDAILRLIALYRGDQRSGKIDLGVGVYKDASGQTPVMRAVKAAEKLLWEQEVTKTYTGLAGEPEYHTAMAGLILGADFAMDRVAAAATPGGTGAIRAALELVKLAAPQATVWLSAPTWPNHPAILRYLGMRTAEYRYFDPETSAVDFAGMMLDLDRMAPGDVVLLHGCCHNPTGANLTRPEWRALADLLEKKLAVPLVDLAYQGFGDGLDADAMATRMLAVRLPEVLIAASCSKNFGIYRERAGILLTLSDPAARGAAQGTLAMLNRMNFSFPPDHGARLVTMILTDPTLRADWQAELEAVRQGMLDLRLALADALRSATGSDRYGFIAQHRGMFSRLGISTAQVDRLRDDHGIYMVGDSRMNIAGLNATTIPVLARAVAEVTR